MFEHETTAQAHNDCCAKCRRVENAKVSRAPLRWKPLVEIQNDAWIETCLEDAKQKAKGIKHSNGLDEHHRETGCAPADCNRRYDQSCADTLLNDRTRNRKKI